VGDTSSERVDVTVQPLRGKARAGLFCISPECLWINYPLLWPWQHFQVYEFQRLAVSSRHSIGRFTVVSLGLVVLSFRGSGDLDDEWRWLLENSLSLSLYMYMCVCVCMCIYICIYIYMPTHTNTHISRVRRPRQFSFWASSWFAFPTQTVDKIFIYTLCWNARRLRNFQGFRIISWNEDTEQGPVCAWGEMPQICMKNILHVPCTRM
jgi:hypothetical protein